MKDNDIGMTDTIKMKIDTWDHHPIKNRPYRVPENERQIIDMALPENDGRKDYWKITIALVISLSSGEEKV